MPIIALTPLILATVLVATPAAAGHINSEQDLAWHIENNPAFDDGTWTRIEKIRWLESQMLESMSGACRYGNGNCPGGKIVNGKCVKADGKIAGSNSNNGNAATGIQSQPATGIQGATEPANPAAVTSVPATGVEGAPVDIPPAIVSVPATGIHGDLPDTESNSESQYRQSGSTLPNGKIPEDIPSVNSDDIIARQFRQAALEATNPVERARLWNEYRRYKNLPPQEAPEG